MPEDPLDPEVPELPLVPEDPLDPEVPELPLVPEEPLSAHDTTTKSSS